MLLLQDLRENLLPLITIFGLISSSYGLPVPTYNYDFCLGSNNTANTGYQSNLSDLLGSLSSAAATNTFYKNTSNGIYGLYLCRGDVAIDVCQNCVNTANQDIQNRCPSNQQAIICDSSIHGNDLMENILQCCQGKIGWRILVPSCNLRYEQYPFFRQPLAPPVPVQVPEPQPLPNNEGKAGTNTTKIVLISVSAFAVVAALVGIYLYCSLGGKRTQIVQESSQVILLNNREGRTRRRFGEESMDKLVQQMDLKSMKETRMDLCGAPESFSRGIVRLALRLQ
ncbi:hypothetical protein F0562_014236 [Nyssa sinensis]|uniref:Gnk2-homologous domain-containing protein n=1 Tax=Nyssa sinensis TaxID=561372 RepID=A0A5J4ZN25_9ASTE|nr:hypothetical protein F0562_014236 [Nyssa sinensis]